MNRILDKSVIDVIKENYEKIFLAEKKVADFIIEHPEDAVNANVSELASYSGVSDATVVRMCHHLGYKGYYQLRIMLAKDVGRKKPEQEDVVDELNAVTTIFQKYANTLVSIGENLDILEMKSCVNLIKECRYAHILAVGNTNPLAQYMGFRLGRLGVKSTHGLSPEYFLNDINLAENEDIIIAISQSGSSRQVIQGIELAKEKGLKVICITGYKESPIAKLSDYALISNGRKEAFDYYKNYEHLKETAVIDALLDLTTNFDTIYAKDADKPEEILSEYKY